ncbi:ribose-phosphate diphosphokinase [Paraburkholderia sp. BCC1886]|uniref:ribose-phosphate diphosphokinase n=1 Tax=Paraburkholderia sp. BCC1886 TaxID=2562670 RepID=UPI0011826295|nr:ribose-phosphate diphosphokinase [Paraburkholderia sp. BCC1886]
MIKLTGLTMFGRDPVALPHTALRFPGGEIHVTLGEHVSAMKGDRLCEFDITAHLPNADAFMELLMVTDALRRSYPGSPLNLHMPYVPYARQDRVNNPGESHSSKVFCSLINAQNYNSVTIQEPHSDVTTALLDRVVVQDPLPAIARVVTQVVAHSGQAPVLISPDAGARKRTLKIAKALNLEVIYADKVRDTKTGAITGTEVQGIVPDAPLLVIDDICDGGRTFIELGKVLPGASYLYLYVTHGIFSKGLDDLLVHFDGIFSSNNWIDDPRCLTV